MTVIGNLLWPFAARVELYAGLDRKLGPQTRFFAAAALTNAALAELCELPRLALWSCGGTLSFLETAGARLECLNRRLAERLEQGWGRGAALDDSLVALEQLELESLLREQARLDAACHRRTVDQVNQLLVWASQVCLPLDRWPSIGIYRRVLSCLRRERGRAVDFARLDDRIEIGVTLTRVLREARAPAAGHGPKLAAMEDPCHWKVP